MKKTGLTLALLLAGGLAQAQHAAQQEISRPVAAHSQSTRQAAEQLFARNVVERSARAQYTAGRSVTLQPGFLASAGSVFQASIQRVTPTLAGAETAQPLRLQAFPNPFTEQTRVEFDLPAEARVRQQLTDAQGRILLQTDDREARPAGKQQLRVGNRELPSGVYFYQITTGRESRTIRLLKE